MTGENHSKPDLGDSSSFASKCLGDGFSRLRRHLGMLPGICKAAIERNYARPDDLPPSGKMLRFGSLNVSVPKLVFVALVVFSLPPRLINLQAPLTGEHEFRQTQTALSVWDIREHGLDLLHPRLPLFGPPWECPFEYPVFQIAAAVLDWAAPWNNLDLSIRVTNLIFFYLTAVMLWMLARVLLADSVPALLTVSVFLFSPYNTFWSRTSMIEYAATFFGVAYLFVFIRWTIKPGKMTFVLCVSLGILGCLAKATSFVVPLITAGAIGLVHLVASLRARGRAIKELDKRRPETTDDFKSSTSNATLIEFALSIALLLVVPLAIGYAYTTYGDAIKEQTPYTAWLSSHHPYTRAWTYGTWHQRIQVRNWALLVTRLLHTAIPALSSALCLGFCVLPFRVRQFAGTPWANVVVGLSLCLAPLVVIVIFFNLYVIHTYYLIACAPLTALYVGAGLGLVFEWLKTRFMRVVLILLLVGLGLQEWSGRLGIAVGSPQPADSTISWLAAAGQSIGRNEPVIIVSPSEWSGFIPYYLKRRAFMALLNNKPVDIQPLLNQGYFKKSGFRWLLVDGNGRSAEELAGRIMKQWKTARLIPLPRSHTPCFLYALSDD